MADVRQPGPSFLWVARNSNAPHDWRSPITDPQRLAREGHDTHVSGAQLLTQTRRPADEDDEDIDSDWMHTDQSGSVGMECVWQCPSLF